MLFPRTIPAFQKLTEFELEIVGRISKEAFSRVYAMNTPYLDFFNESVFSKEITKKDIEEAEDYIGISFDYLIFSNQRRWRWINKKGVKEKLARYVMTWRNILRGTDILVTYMENLFFINTAEFVAEKMGVKMIKIARSEVVKNSMIFWDENNNPLFNREYQKGVLENMMERTRQKKTVKIDKGAMNNFGILASKVPNIPAKMKTLFSDPRNKLDADIPRPLAKYKRLLSVGLRYLIYPSLQSIFFEHPKESENYFLYPLHYEWEAQLAYREPFLNQIELAGQIANCLPDDTWLYVKVHPHWKNADQGIRDIMKLKKHKVRIIHPNENTMDLINRSLGVIVINSTVGYEALVLGKPLIVLGHEIYRKAGIDVKDMNSLPQVLGKVKNNYVVDKKAYEKFLKQYTSQVITTENLEEIAAELKKAIEWRMKN